MTLLRDGVYTVLPYTLETLRCVNMRIPLSETVGKKKRAVFQDNGKAIRGCFITLITMSNMRELLSLITSPEESFDILMNRGYEKVIYRNLTLRSFELRSRDDENVTLKIEVRESEDSYTDYFSPVTPDLFWEREKTLNYMDYDLTEEGRDASLGIYRFSFLGKFEGAASYSLRVYGPVLADSALNENESIEQLFLLCLLMTEEDTISLKIKFTNLCPAGSTNGSDTHGEQLMCRLFRIEGPISIEERGTNTYWGKEL